MLKRGNFVSSFTASFQNQRNYEQTILICFHATIELDGFIRHGPDNDLWPDH